MSVRFSRLSLILSVLAVLFAGLRWTLSIHAIPAELVQYSVLHDVAWAPADKTLTITGTDPYVIFILPADTKPIRQASVIFDGAHVPTEGTFYMFQTPLSPSDADAMEPVIGKVNARGGQFVVSAALADSLTLRLDLPDYGLRPLRLRRVVLETPFAQTSSWLFRATLICAALAIASFAFRAYQQRTRSG